MVYPNIYNGMSSGNWWSTWAHGVHSLKRRSQAVYGFIQLFNNHWQRWNQTWTSNTPEKNMQKLAESSWCLVLTVFIEWLPSITFRRAMRVQSFVKVPSYLGWWKFSRGLAWRSASWTFTAWQAEDGYPTPEICVILCDFMWFCFIPCEIVTVFSFDCGLEIVGGWVDDTLMLNRSSTSISHHFTFQHVLLGHRPPVCSSCRCAIAWHGRVPLAYTGIWHELPVEGISSPSKGGSMLPRQCCPEISQTRRNHQGPGGPSFHGNLPSTVSDNIQYISMYRYTHINTHTHRDTQTHKHTHRHTDTNRDIWSHIDIFA